MYFSIRSDRDVSTRYECIHAIKMRTQNTGVFYIYYNTIIMYISYLCVAFFLLFAFFISRPLNLCLSYTLTNTLRSIHFIFPLDSVRRSVSNHFILWLAICVHIAHIYFDFAEKKIEWISPNALHRPPIVWRALELHCGEYRAIPASSLWK